VNGLTILARVVSILDRVAWPLAALFLAFACQSIFGWISREPSWPDAVTDMSVYLDAARALVNGQNIYDPAHYPFDVYGYPPLFAEIIAGARMILGDGPGWLVWMGLSATALFAALAIMMRGFGKPLAWKWVVLTFSIFIAGRVARSDLFHLQPDFFLLLLIVLGIRFFGANKPIAGGVAWGAVFVCKPFTGVLLFWLMRRGDWRAVSTTFSAATVLFVGSFLPFLPNIIDGVKGWASASGFHTGWPNVAKTANETFYGLFQRLFGPETRFSAPWIEIPEIIPYLAAPFLLLTIGGFLLGVSRKSETATIPADERPAHDMAQIAMVLGLSMSCGPLMEQPHCFLLLPGLIGSITLAKRRWRENAATRWRWLASAIAWSLAMFWLAFPMTIPIVATYSLGQITGPMLLITMKMSLCVLASCLLTVFAFLGDRAVRMSERPGWQGVIAASPAGARS
jgi:hypothetical protein